MRNLFLLMLVFAAAAFAKSPKAPRTVMADSLTHLPLPYASVYDNAGIPAGMTDSRGRLPRLPVEAYPIKVRYVGFREMVIPEVCGDTVFMVENVEELPEVVVLKDRNRVLHILAYVREKSTLTTYRDTVVLFREKMVDYMLPTTERTHFKGWSMPRVLGCRSYYRFTDRNGTDSVSDACRHHFSWSDWLGLPPVVSLPAALTADTCATDTLKGRYSPALVWNRHGDEVAVNVNVLADPGQRSWVPDMDHFFHNGVEFERFRVNYAYSGVNTDSLSPLFLSHYACNIESRGRGHAMFRFNRLDEPYYVTTDADVYIVDKEYITVGEARRWEKRKFDPERTMICEPPEAPALAEEDLALVERVGRVNKDYARQHYTPDARLASKNLDAGRRNFRIGRRALMMLKQVTGISSIKHRRKMKKDWQDFKQYRMNRPFQP